MGFAPTFSSPATPYYGGALASVPNPPTNVALDGINYPIDLKLYRHNGLPGFREGVVQSAEPTDSFFDSQGAWWRYRFGWQHGAGQRIIDLGEDNDPYRFDTSLGIDPWTRFQACLLPDTERILADTAVTIYMGSTQQHLYVSDGQTVKRSADLISWTTLTGLAAESVTGITSDGTNAYICTTGHVYEAVLASAAVNDITATGMSGSLSNITFVGNRLLVSEEDKLQDVSGAAASQVRDHFQDAFRWTVAFQVGSRIYVGGYAGNRSQIFTTTTDDTGALVLSAEAADFFSGEQLRAGISYGGQVILASNKGVRFAVLSADGTLEYGPLISAPGDVLSVAAEGRFVYFGWENHLSGGSGVGRVALDEFVDTLQPAYASDIYTLDVDAAVTAVQRFNNRTCFAVSGDGVYADDPGTYVTSGYIETGELYFGTVEDKSLGQFQVRVNELATGESVTMELTNDESGVVIEDATVSTVNSTGLVLDADGVVANRITARLTLAGPGTSSPCLRHWRGRAYPIAPTTEEWIVPLIVHRRVTIGDGQGQVLSMDPWDEVSRLKEHWRTKKAIMYQEGDHAFRVRIDNYEIKPHKWTDDGDWLEVTMTLRLLSL